MNLPNSQLQQTARYFFETRYSAGTAFHNLKPQRISAWPWKHPVTKQHYCTTWDWKKNISHKNHTCPYQNVCQTVSTALQHTVCQHMTIFTALSIILRH